MKIKAFNSQIFVEMICFAIFGVTLLYLVKSNAYLSYVTPRMKPYLYFTAAVMFVWSAVSASRLFHAWPRKRAAHCYVLIIPVLLLLLPHGSITSANLSARPIGGNVGSSLSISTPLGGSTTNTASTGTPSDGAPSTSASSDGSTGAPADGTPSNGSPSGGGDSATSGSTLSNNTPSADASAAPSGTSAPSKSTSTGGSSGGSSATSGGAPSKNSSTGGSSGSSATSGGAPSKNSSTGGSSSSSAASSGTPSKNSSTGGSSSSNTDSKVYTSVDAFGTTVALHGYDAKNKKIVISNDEFYPWISELFTKLDDFIGYKVTITGYVYHDPEYMAKNEFVPARLLMSCCVADLTPCGLVCNYGEAAELKQDEWVTVTGTIFRGKYMGSDEPQIKVESIAPADPISDYIYPF